MKKYFKKSKETQGKKNLLNKLKKIIINLYNGNMEFCQDSCPVLQEEL